MTIWKIAFLTVLWVLISYVIWAVVAEARPMMCGPTALVVEKLRQKYGEEPIGQGISVNGTLLYQLFVSRATGKFTVTAATPSGEMCILGAGIHWLVLDWQDDKT